VSFGYRAHVSPAGNDIHDSAAEFHEGTANTEATNNSRRPILMLMRAHSSAAVTHSWRYSEGVLDGEVCGWCGMLPAVERIRFVSKIF
jgi:hypothetical protein